MIEGDSPTSKVQSLFVGKIARETTEDELRSIFEQYGKVEQFKMMPAKGVKTRCAFITFSSKQESDRAIQMLHNKEINGQEIRVVYSDRENEGRQRDRRPREEDRRRFDDYYDRRPIRRDSPVRRERSPIRHERRGYDLDEISTSIDQLEFKVDDLRRDSRTRHSSRNIEDIRRYLGRIEEIKEILYSELDRYERR